LIKRGCERKEKQNKRWMCNTGKAKGEITKEKREGIEVEKQRI